MSARKEFGDFQTPLALARESVDRVGRMLGWTPSLVLEPTCGQGAFVVAAAQRYGDTSRIVGVDINAEYVAEAVLKTSRMAPSARVEVFARDFFHHDWSSEVRRAKGNVLIVGNPPWVTNALLGSFKSMNLPEKTNFQRLRGLDALTGKSNFDISEWMLLRYVDWLSPCNGAFAVLCKTAVARKLAKQIWSKHPGRTRQSMFLIDAKAEFGVSVEACLYFVEFGHSDAIDACDVYSDLRQPAPSSSFGMVGGSLVSNAAIAAGLERFTGASRFRWRSGIKHDCSAVLELRRHGDALLNGLDEVVDIEPEVLYPLAKCSDVNAGEYRNRYLVVPHRKLGEQTSGLRLRAPRAWDYLSSNQGAFERRSSRIYSGKPQFSLFGIGDYSFQPWKIAVASLYKRLSFQPFGPVDGKPLLFDDTVSFLSFADERSARQALSVLTSDEALAFYNSHIFWSEKRPLSIEVLNRLNLEALAEHLGSPLQPESAQQVLF